MGIEIQFIDPPVDLYPNEQRGLLCPTCGEHMVLYKSAKRKLPVYLCRLFPDCKTTHPAYEDGAPHPGFVCENEIPRIRLAKEALRRKRKEERRAKQEQQEQELTRLRELAYMSLSEILKGYTTPSGRVRRLSLVGLPKWSSRWVGTTLRDVSQVWSLKRKYCHPLIAACTRKKQNDFIRVLFHRFYAKRPDGTRKTEEEQSRDWRRALEYIKEQTNVSAPEASDFYYLLTPKDREVVLRLLLEMKNLRRTIDDFS